MAGILAPSREANDSVRPGRRILEFALSGTARTPNDSVSLGIRSLPHAFQPIRAGFARREFFRRTADLRKSGNKVNFGVIGYGYWGPNVVRNLASLEGRKRLAIADLSAAARCARKRHILDSCNGRRVGGDQSTEIDAVAVVSPVWTHYELAKAALENGKHVFVEKPFTSTAAQGEELINLAQQKNLKIMVDHTFFFTGAVRKIRQLIEEGRWASSTTTTRPASIWGSFSTTSTCSGIWPRTICPSWTT